MDTTVRLISTAEFRSFLAKVSSDGQIYQTHRSECDKNKVIAFKIFEDIWRFTKLTKQNYDSLLGSDNLSLEEFLCKNEKQQ